MTPPWSSIAHPAADLEAEGGSIQSRVHAALQVMIADGRLQPGERLIETRVAAAFGVSRSPVRASLAALWRERKLRKAEGHGYLVSGPASVATLGRLATLDVPAIEPAPLWAPIYAEVESTLARHVLFHSVRLTEARLGQHFGVSRTVVRDVLGRMHAVGLVGKDRPGRWQAERLTPERLQHLYELRWLIEPAALRLAAPLIPPARLWSVASQMRAKARSSTGSAAVFDHQEQLLHVDLLGYCPNLELLRALQPTRLLLVLNRYLRDLSIAPPVQMARTTMSEHREVVDLLLAGQVGDACTALEQHLRHSAEIWRSRYRRAQSAPRREAPPDWLATVGTAIGESGRRAGR